MEEKEGGNDNIITKVEEIIKARESRRLHCLCLSETKVWVHKNLLKIDGQLDVYKLWQGNAAVRPNYFSWMQAESKRKKFIAAGETGHVVTFLWLCWGGRGAKITVKEFVFKFLLALIIHAIWIFALFKFWTLSGSSATFHWLCFPSEDESAFEDYATPLPCCPFNFRSPSRTSLLPSGTIVIKLGRTQIALILGQT